MNSDRDAFSVDVRRVVVLFCLILISTNAFAVKNYFEISDSEMRMLPKFCKTGFGSYSFEKKEWMNHLCPGLNALNHARMTAGSSQARKFALNEAENHLTYTLTKVNDFPFRSAVFVSRGEVFEMKGDTVSAIADYNQALKIRPKSMSAYAHLVDAYIKIGDREQARKIVNQGLKVNPKSRALLRRKQKLL